MELKITKEDMAKKKLMVCTPMFGGLCHGAYMQSMLQLQGVCQQYGVQLSVSTILNESLIQRARSYLTDGFMQSDCTHLLFIDADIGFNAQDVIFMLGLQTPGSKYDIVAGPYAKKCLHRSSKILTEDGYIPIAKIVRDKFSGMVRTIDKDGNASWNKVTNWWAEKNTQGKRWVSLKTSTVRPRAVLTVTDDHEIAYVDNVFDPHIKYCRADEMIGRYMVVNPEHKSKNRWYNALWNKEQVSAAIGTILGDGCVGGGVLAEGHGKNQIPYCDHKARLLGAVPRGQTFSYVNAQTKELFELIGVGKDRKTIKNVIDMIDDIALAYLYMDDGNLYKYNDRAKPNGYDNWWINTNTGDVKRQAEEPFGEGWLVGRSLNLSEGRASIATMSFTIEDNELLIKHLHDRFDLDSSIMYLQPGQYGNRFPFIQFDQENTKKLHAIIAPYVQFGMDYKLVDSVRDIPKKTLNDKPFDFSAIKVTSVDDVRKPLGDSWLYDIEVENDHNFIANGVLAHNCLSYEKLKQAVDSGVADKDPTILENFVGDFVFNPIAQPNASGQIRLDEPLEIAETGTGFMMIQRESLERWEKANEDRKYLPDHVRSKGFDGSREIYEYFTVKVDPVSRRLLSEDYQLCHEFRKADMHVWICPWIRLTHYGTMAFGGSLPMMLNLGISATADPARLGSKK